MKYSKQTTEKICSFLKEGMGRVKAAKSAGVAFSTFHHWCQTKSEFLDAVKKAEDEFFESIKAGCVGNILKATQKAWQAAAWLLERKFPEEFSNSYKFAAQMLKDNEEFEKEIIELVKDYVPKEKRKELIAAFEKRAKMGEAVRSITEPRK